MFRHLITYVILVLLLPGCSGGPDSRPAVVKEGLAYGVTKGIFNGHWWNYLERGMSFAEGGCWSEAEADFTAAIQRRPRDQRRARTYGMHFVDYFPHRELGIVYYRTGRYEQAARELENSLRAVDSAKAKFYLNKARRELSGHLDRRPPRIDIIDPAQDLITNQQKLAVRGTIMDDTFVSGVEINGRPLFIELAAPEQAVRGNLDLVPGVNTIEVRAVDLARRSSSLSRTVILDPNGPSVSLTAIERQADGSCLVEGEVYDRYGLADLTVNGRSRKVDTGARARPFTECAPPGDFSFTARDMAGNTTSGRLDLRNLSNIPRPGRIMLAARDPGLPWPTAEDRGPRITVRGLSARQDAFLDQVFIEGRVTGEARISSISVNGLPLDFRPGGQVFFNHLARLKVGENIFTILAADIRGRVAEKKIIINRRRKTVRKTDARLTMAVMPFHTMRGTEGLAELAHDLFQNHLLDLDRFHLVTRTDFDKVLSELNLGASVLVSPETALRAGRIAAAENIVTGSLVEREGTVEITINAIDTETARIMASCDVYAESAGLPVLNSLAAGLALKLERCFPRLEGLIIKIKHGEFFLDLGNDSGLRPEMQLVAFRDGPRILHPVTGLNLGRDTIDLGTLVVTKVHSRFAVAALRTGRQDQAIRVMDRVITK